jgi:hypothetical protein|tara:strand:- start:9 stop:1586 length:1578 start_codon:yes stop_codon:yes gene_type:complete
MHVAVVQISKIQIRRGKKNSSSGVPQLSSAELAWAVDTQELYIGNGSTQEGAPAVGNTKVLTEHDNILELASSYKFSSTTPSITQSTSRTLLGKIDEIEVSVADFGAVSDGSTDNVTAFENAFTQLFRNADPNFKKILVVPNGEYLFTQDLKIPSNAIIRGETASGAVLNLDTRNIQLISANGTALSSFSSSDRPTNIEIHNITLKRSSGSLVLTGLKDAEFNGIIFKGEYNLGNVVNSYASEPSAVDWSNDFAGLKVDNIKFKNCSFKENSIGIKCTQTIVTNTKVQIIDCNFNELDTGIYINGVVGQGNNWIVNDCNFTEVAAQAFNSLYGYGTILNRCDFVSCGNGTGSSANPLTSIVSFGESRNNVVKDCTSDRQQDAGIVNTETVAAITEVSGSDLTSFTDRNYSPVYTTDSFRPVAVFSAMNTFITLNYTLRLANHIRKGTAQITIGDDITKLSISDNYEYSDTSVTSTGGILMTGFEFAASLRDNDTDSGIDTVVLSYKNPIATGATGDLSFDIQYGI